MNLEEQLRPYVGGFIGACGFHVVKEGLADDLPTLFWCPPGTPILEGRKLAVATRATCDGKALGFIMQSITTGQSIDEITRPHEWGRKMLPAPAEKHKETSDDT